MKSKRLIFSIWIFCLLYNCISAQESSGSTPDKKEMRERKKLEKELELQKKFDALFSLLDNRSFVLRAEHVTQGAANWEINKSLSFVRVDSATVTLQVSPAYGFSDNGFNGATSQGTITKYKLTKNDKHKSCDLSVTFKAGVYGVFILLFSFSSEGISSVNIVQEKGQAFRLDGYIYDLKHSGTLDGFIRQ